MFLIQREERWTDTSCPFPGGFLAASQAQSSAVRYASFPLEFCVQKASRSSAAILNLQSVLFRQLWHFRSYTHYLVTRSHGCQVTGCCVFCTVPPGTCLALQTFSSCRTRMHNRRYSDRHESCGLAHREKHFGFTYTNGGCRDRSNATQAGVHKILARQTKFVPAITHAPPPRGRVLTATSHYISEVFQVPLGSLWLEAMLCPSPSAWGGWALFLLTSWGSL